MKKNNIFIACDSTNISKIRKIIHETQNTKIKIGYNTNFQLLKTEYLLCQNEMKQLLEKLLMKLMV